MNIDLPNSPPVNPDTVFATVYEASTSGELGQKITRRGLYYEASLTDSDLLDQVMPNGSRLTGHFNNGDFTPGMKSNI